MQFYVGTRHLIMLTLAVKVHVAQGSSDKNSDGVSVFSHCSSNNVDVVIRMASLSRSSGGGGRFPWLMKRATFSCNGTPTIIKAKTSM